MANGSSIASVSSSSSSPCFRSQSGTRVIRRFASAASIPVNWSRQSGVPTSTTTRAASAGCSAFTIHATCVLLRDRRQVHELQVHVLVRNHSRLGKLRRERIRAGLRPGAGQTVVQGGLARVGRAEQGDLGRALRAHHVARPGAGAALAARGELFGELLDPRLDVGLKVLGPLVLGNGPKHLAQPFEALLRLARLAERGFGGLVVRAQVGGHRCWLGKRTVAGRGRFAHPPPEVKARSRSFTIGGRGRPRPEVGRSVRAPARR